MPFDLRVLLDQAGIEHRVLEDRPALFEAIVPPAEANSSSLVFIRRPSAETFALLRSCPARVFLLPRDWGLANEEELRTIDAAIVLVDQPRTVVSALLHRMHPDEDRWPSGVHPTATIDPAAVLDPTVTIGPHAIIGRVKLGPHVRIGAFTVLHDNVTMGANVTVREHCTIGGPGFGFVRHDDGKLERIPHVGGVVIEDDVDVFPFANIDRGTLGPTFIGRGSKVDHYVHVSHNSHVGEDCLLTAGVILCGKSQLGPRVWGGVGAIVKEGVRVGAGATLGLGAVAVKDVEPGATVVGVPAKALVR